MRVSLCLASHPGLPGLRQLPLLPSRHSVCGPNAIEIEIRPVWKLLFREVTGRPSLPLGDASEEEPWGLGVKA